MAGMGFQKKMFGWVVIQGFYGFLEFFNFAKSLNVPLHDTIRSCGALRLPCTSANRNVWRFSRMFRADENRMTWH